MYESILRWQCYLLFVENCLLWKFSYNMKHVPAACTFHVLYIAIVRKFYCNLRQKYKINGLKIRLLFGVLFSLSLFEKKHSFEFQMTFSREINPWNMFLKKNGLFRNNIVQQAAKLQKSATKNQRSPHFYNQQHQHSWILSTLLRLLWVYFSISI